MLKFTALVISLTIAAPAFAGRPIKIGVVAIGPRSLPAQGCGWSPRPASFGEPANTGTTAPLYDILGVEFGLKEIGKHYTVDTREGSLDQLNGQAADLVKKGVDFIIGIAGEGVDAAQTATKKIPILFPQISNPVAAGEVGSWWVPGASTSGISANLVGLSTQRLDLFKALMGSRPLKTVATLYRPDDGPSVKAVGLLTDEGSKLGITIAALKIQSRQDVIDAIAAFPSLGVDGFVMIPDSLVASNMDLIINWSDQHKIPVMGVHDYLADWGAVATFGSNPHGAGRELAYFIDRVSRGGDVGSIPVMTVPPNFVINLKAAACMGITVPPEVIKQANRVIQ